MTEMRATNALQDRLDLMIDVVVLCRADRLKEPPMSEQQWQPIETAPKDETPVRLKWAGTTVEAIGRWCPAQVLPSGFGRPNYSDDWRDVEGDDVLLMPTHWKPVHP